MVKIKKSKVKIETEQSPALERFIEVIILLASFIIGLITMGLSLLGKFNVFETCTTTMLSFLCAEYFGNSIILKSKYFKARKEYSLVEEANDWTEKFFDMNEYCKTIINNGHGQQDLFLISCKKSIDNLYYVLQMAARDEKIEVSSDYIINSVGVFDALNVSDDKTVELTFPIDEVCHGILQTAEDRKFFETSYRMVQSGRVEKIKVLLILGEESFINDSQIIALCNFYDSNPGFEGKYISKTDFVKACESNMISSKQLDFGIYGPRMLFKVESYDPYTGGYTKNAAEVQRYKKLYDEMWNFASMTHELPGGSSSEKKTPMNIKDLFESLKRK